MHVILFWPAHRKSASICRPPKPTCIVHNATPAQVAHLGQVSPSIKKLMSLALRYTSALTVLLFLRRHSICFLSCFSTLGLEVACSSATPDLCHLALALLHLARHEEKVRFSGSDRR